MSFAINMYDVPYVTSYAEAVAFYERSVPWRNGGEDRPLVNKRHRGMGVRLAGDAVVFRYHTTDVVIWRPDNSYELDNGRYSSRSTCEFANNFMPSMHWLMSETRHLRINDHIYPIWDCRRLRVSADGAVSGPGLGRFMKRTVNRKRARTLLKSLGYYEYLDWHKTMYPMVRDTMPPTWKREHVRVDQIVALLAHGVDAYYPLMMSNGGEPDTVREVLYAAFGDARNVWDAAYHDRLPISTNLRGYDVVMKGNL